MTDTIEPHAAIVIPNGAKIKSQLKICRIPDRGTEKIKVSMIIIIP
jgi:hypothetical protein